MRWDTHWWLTIKNNAMPVSKITIVPHTQGALGYTLHLPEEEEVPYDPRGPALRDPDPIGRSFR